MGSPWTKSLHPLPVHLTPNIFNGYAPQSPSGTPSCRPYDLPNMAGSAGRACTDDEVLVVKAHEDRKAEPWELVAQDNQEVGEIIIKSPGQVRLLLLQQRAGDREALLQRLPLHRRPGHLG